MQKFKKYLEDNRLFLESLANVVFVVGLAVFLVGSCFAHSGV